MNKYSSKKFKILAGGVCIIFTLAGLGVVYFFFAKYQDSIKKLSLHRQKVKALAEELENLDELLAKYKKDKQHFEGILFKDKDIPLFLEGVSALSKRFNIKIRDIKTQPTRRVEAEEEISRRGMTKKTQEKEKPTLLFTPLSLRVKGRFANLVDFLLALERYRQLLSLTEVKIKTRKYPLLECSFSLNLYSLRL